MEKLKGLSGVEAAVEWTYRAEISVCVCVYISACVCVSLKAKTSLKPTEGNKRRRRLHSDLILK